MVKLTLNPGRVKVDLLPVMDGDKDGKTLLLQAFANNNGAAAKLLLKANGKLELRD